MKGPNETLQNLPPLYTLISIAIFGPIFSNEIDEINNIYI